MKFTKKLLTICICMAIFIASNMYVYVKCKTNENTNFIYGFKLLKQEYIKGINSKLLVYKHIKTGAHIVCLKNNDSNKVFSVNFKTPPSDDTGVNHIIEHSVLCGSKHYPAKDLFLQMMKGSLNTYMNAQTGPDTTMYPASSRNYRDFKNLLSVYLDAVFYPNFLKQQNIFKEEGWRYELNPKDNSISYNGVVYNEMKGDMSSPDSLLNQKISQTLFPDTCYRWNSGGDPAAIPSLSYSKFLSTYKKYYVPSNCYIYLYGNLNPNPILNFINKNYLRKFSSSTKNIKNVSIGIEKPFKSTRLQTFTYPVNNNTPTTKSFITANYVVGTALNAKLSISFNILNKLLLGNSASPLKKFLSSNNLGNNIYGSYSNYCLQPVFSIISEDSNYNEPAKFKALIDSYLSNAIKNGFSKDLVTSAINSAEFDMRKNAASAQRGLNFNYDIMNSCLYGGNAAKYLNFSQIFNSIRKSANNGYFEKLTKEYILNNKNSAVISLFPNYKNKLTDSKKYVTRQVADKLLEQQIKFNKWEQKPDSAHVLNTVPKLSISDIEKKANVIPCIKITYKGLTVLLHPIYTNKISYVSIYFDTSSVPQDKLPYLYLLKDILGELGTTHYSSDNLNKATFKYGGSFTFNTTAIPKYKSDQCFYPKFEASFCCLSSNLTKCCSIMNDIIKNTKFDDKEKLHQLIKQLLSNRSSYIVNNAEVVAKTRLESYFSYSRKYDELGNINYYNFLSSIDKNYDYYYKSLANNLNYVLKSFLTSKNAIVSFTDDNIKKNRLEKYTNSILNGLGQNKNMNYKSSDYIFDSNNKNEGIAVPLNVQHVFKGGNYIKCGFKYSGRLKVLQNILDTAYLWPQVRVKGGAYGCYFNITNYGIADFFSYRDPNIIDTLKVFNKSGSFIKNFKCSKKEFNDYIVGTIGNTDPLLDPENAASAADYNYISGRTQKDLQNERSQILSTSINNINNYSILLDKVIKNNYICVIGNKTNLLNSKNCFTKIILLK